MATRMNGRVAQRSSVPLTDDDLRDLELVRSSSAHRAALGELTGELSVLEEVTRAALLHAVFRAGLAAVNDAAEEAGYAALADQRLESAHREQARRRRPAWASEE